MARRSYISISGCLPALLASFSAAAETKAECLATADAIAAIDDKYYAENQRLTSRIRDDERAINRGEFQLTGDQAHLDAVTLRDQLRYQAEDAKTEAAKRDKDRINAESRAECNRKK
jgi:hypothetical protein